ncbi:MAG: hypothetical protein A7315_04245 [Candidatus Altiarchaeales archaeon WOR_SM1_79]|nr:MAG: hypothetical protein A7315_04245 [Candidatus Altiarchaeales archaeon WOR_SM1_79]
MATIKSIEFGGEILATFSISEKEYDLLKRSERDIVILPARSDVLDDILTTGRLGNGNRIMLPTKILRKHNIKKLLKNVPAKIFEVDDSKFLLIRLEKYKPGVPVFKEDKYG